MSNQSTYFPASARKKLAQEKRGNNASDQSEYTSEFTQFIDAFLKQHPEVVQDQRKGWNIFWDKKVDLAELEDARQDSVPAKPYSYD